MDKEKKSDDLIGVKEASKILGCHENTLRQWDRKGYIVAKRFGIRKDRRYRRGDVEKLSSWAPDNSI